VTGGNRIHGRRKKVVIDNVDRAGSERLLQQRNVSPGSHNGVYPKICSYESPDICHQVRPALNVFKGIDPDGGEKPSGTLVYQGGTGNVVATSTVAKAAAKVSVTYPIANDRCRRLPRCQEALESNHTRTGDEFPLRRHCSSRLASRPIARAQPVGPERRGR
jgi:hypothetical protein